MPETRSSSKNQNEPINSSTPRSSPGSLGITGRCSIHEQDNVGISMLSPIPPNVLRVPEEVNDSDEAPSESDSNLESDTGSELYPSPNLISSRAGSAHQEPHEFRKGVQIPESTYFSPNAATTFVNNPPKARIWVVISPLVILVGVVCAYPLYSNSSSTIVSASNVTLLDLRTSFPGQSNDLWLAFKSGIEDVKVFDKPSVFLLLYEQKSQGTLNKLVHKMSQYAICEIKCDCTLTPIISNEILHSERAVLDYGNLIVTFKNDLENKGVMITNNLEQVKGKVAQIFHSMCDEYTPLVNNAVFIFTMKVKRFPTEPNQDMHLVEDVLHSNWKDLDDDIFYPLFTRITSMVLRILPEV